MVNFIWQDLCDCWSGDQKNIIRPAPKLHQGQLLQLVSGLRLAPVQAVLVCFPPARYPAADVITLIHTAQTTLSGVNQSRMTSPTVKWTRANRGNQRQQTDFHGRKFMYKIEKTKIGPLDKKLFSKNTVSTQCETELRKNRFQRWTSKGTLHTASRRWTCCDESRLNNFGNQRTHMVPEFCLTA